MMTKEEFVTLIYFIMLVLDPTAQMNSLRDHEACCRGDGKV
jgi:hypothetical protein